MDGPSVLVIAGVTGTRPCGPGGAMGRPSALMLREVKAPTANRALRFSFLAAMVGI